MLGHVIFEMACLKEPDELIPSPGEYRHGDADGVAEVLDFIFNQKNLPKLKSVSIAVYNNMGRAKLFFL